MQRIVRTALAAAAVLTLAVAPAPALAQRDVGPTAIGLEAGLPLVLGLDVSYRFDDRWRGGIALGKLSGLTALRAEAQWLLRTELRERLVPSIIVGAEQYFLEDGPLDATPLGLHAAIGLDFHLASPVSIGARIGGLKTFGSSGGGDARVFSVENGHATGTFNFGVRYHF